MLLTRGNADEQAAIRKYYHNTRHLFSHEAALLQARLTEFDLADSDLDPICRLGKDCDTMLPDSIVKYFFRFFQHPTSNDWLSLHRIAFVMLW